MSWSHTLGSPSLTLPLKMLCWVTCSPCMVHACFVAQSVWLFWDPMDYSPQAPLSMGFSRQGYWSELPFPTPRESSQSRDWTHICLLCLLHWLAVSLPLSPLGSPLPSLYDMVPYNKCRISLHYKQVSVDWLYCKWVSRSKFGSVGKAFATKNLWVLWKLVTIQYKLSFLPLKALTVYSK